jgi:hypothetical protein
MESPDQVQKRPRALLWYLLPVIVLAVAIRLPFASFLIPDGLGDDGYITLRYAANLADGQGFVYNRGEPVWGTTTPLLTLILYGVAAAFGPGALEPAALGIGIAASVAFWVLLLMVCEHERIPRVVSVPVLLMAMFAPSYFENSLSGMETPLVLALMALSLYLYITDRPVGLGLVAGLLLLTRVDTLIWIGVLGGAYLLRHLRSGRGAIAWAASAFGVVVIPWHVFAYFTFGSVIPNSLKAKAVNHESFTGVDLSYFLRIYHLFFPVLRLGSYAWVGVGVTLAVVLVGCWLLAKDYRRLWPIGAFFFCFLASYWLGRAPLYSWYFPPSQWAALFLFCLGLYGLWNRWPAVAANRLARVAPYAALAAVILAAGVVGNYRLWAAGPVNARWVELGNFLKENTRADSKVFLEHIGLIGFKSGRPILDNMGLVSPEIVDLKKKYPDNDEWLRAALTQYKPEVVVLYDPQDPKFGKGRWRNDERAWFARQYRFVKRIDSQPTSYVYFRTDMVN